MSKDEILLSDLEQEIEYLNQYNERLKSLIMNYVRTNEDLDNHNQSRCYDCENGYDCGVSWNYYQKFFTASEELKGFFKNEP